jgi:aminoglycoside 3-N-acetyltransferase
MTLIVHSSLRSIGQVVGGAVSVILALEEAIGEEGNLVMPTQSEYLCDPTENNENLSDEEIKIIRNNLPLYYPDLTQTS